MSWVGGSRTTLQNWPNSLVRCSVMFWNGVGGGRRGEEWGRGRVETCYNTQFTGQLLHHVLEQSEVGGGGEGVEGKRHTATQGGLTKDPPSCSVMFWNEGGGGGGVMEGKKHAATQDPPSCSVKFWNEGVGGGWRVRNMLQLKVALQKILPAATSSSGMKGWGEGGRVRDMLQLKVALQKILPAATSSSGMKGWGGGGGG